MVHQLNETTNRCWTRAMGGEQEIHIGDCSLIYLEQDKDILLEEERIKNALRPSIINLMS